MPLQHAYVTLPAASNAGGCWVKFTHPPHFRPQQAGFLPRKFAKIAKHPAVVRLVRFLAAIPSVAFDRQNLPVWPPDGTEFIFLFWRYLALPGVIPSTLNRRPELNFCVLCAF
jgi:hypothetical protein